MPEVSTASTSQTFATDLGCDWWGRFPTGTKSFGPGHAAEQGIGLPYGKTAAVLEQAFGLRVSRAGLCQAMARVARKAEPTYDALIEQIRGSPSVTPDETGWRVGGRLWRMWAFSSSLVASHK
jgi:hypothetical protein